MSNKDKNPQIYIAKLSSSVTERDLSHKFTKYGDIKNIQLKSGYAFIVLTNNNNFRNTSIIEMLMKP